MATQISGSFTGTGQSATSHASRGINISLTGTFAGTVAVERSFDGTNWEAVTDLGTNGSFTAPVSTTWTEVEGGVEYRFNCTAYTSGTINYRLGCSGY